MAADAADADLADGEWRLVREEARDGPLNMALDEAAARSAAEDGVRTLRVYRWTPGTLSLGYHQDPETVDWAFCDREGIAVTRRQTGGGAIYHDDWGDISYSVVAPADDLPGDLMDSYELLCEPLLDALDRMGVDAGLASEKRPPVYRPACYLRRIHPAHDVVAADGRKVSGNAQYRQRDAVIQHGSLTFARATDRHLACFADPPDAAAFEDRVSSVREQAGIDREAAVATLERALADWVGAREGTWRDAELAHARDLADAKYRSDTWTREGEDPTG